MSEEPGGAVCMVFGDTDPDWVELPPQLGGGRKRVEEVFYSACPCVKKDKLFHSVRHLRIEGGLGVAECIHKGFLWYEAPEKEKDNGNKQQD